MADVNFSLIATKVQRWTQNQIEEVDDAVEEHIIRIRKDNGTGKRSYFCVMRILSVRVIIATPFVSTQTNKTHI